MNFKKEAFDFSDKGLSKFPDKIFESGRIYKLNLSGNNIKEIPREIEQLRFLETLNLSGNRIRHLQAKLFNLKNLKILILNNNEVITLPKQVKNLEKLKILDLANNNLSGLPVELMELQNLVELNLTGNRIDYFPTFENAYGKLKSLWLGHNPLKNTKAKNIVGHLSQLNNLYCFSAKLNNPISNNDQILFEASSFRGNVLPMVIKKLLDQTEAVVIPELPKLESIMKTGPLKIFISYAHAPDGDYYLKRTQEHLKTLSFEMKIDVWADNKLRGSDLWDNEIKRAINEADAAILLISNAFLASDYIRKDELPPLLKAAKENGVRIYPILVHPSIFTKVPSLKEFQAINSPTETLSELDYPKQERVFIKLLDDIQAHFGKNYKYS